MRKLLSTLIFVISVFGVAAQGGGTEDRKASNFYEEARQHKRFGRVEQAEIYFQKALERDPEYLDALFDLSDMYMKMGKTAEAKKHIESIVAKDERFAPSLIVTLAMMVQMEDDFQKALGYYEQYMTIAPPESNNYQAAKRGAANCEFAMWAMEHPVPFEPKNLGPGVNSENDEYFPAMTANQELLIYTREFLAPNNPMSPDGKDEDFFFSERQEDGSWGPAYNPGRPINSSWREGAPTISPDGKYIIFTICDLYGQYGSDKEGFGSCDLFVSVRNGKSWSRPVNMGRTINSKNWESQPSFASDGKTLYFVRGRYSRDHERFDDIYFSELVNGKWSQATALPPNINSTEDEESVFIHPDNKTLYFSSRGHVGLGNMDIFMTRKNDDGSWSDPVNLGYPINTPEHENSFFVSADGEYAIIASNREGGFGKLDLYSFELPEALKPNPVTYLQGRIKDAATGKPLEAFFTLIDLSTEDTIARASSDKEDGTFLVVLPSSENYMLTADKTGYLFHSENFELDLATNKSHYNKNIELQPIEAGRSVVLKNVFFDSDKFDLKPASKTELNKLADLLNANPNIKIEVSGHTDNQGNATANQTLSENRAKAVYQYLMDSGISGSRLMYKGYGQTKPIATNDTEEGRALNRRTEFTVLE